MARSFPVQPEYKVFLEILRNFLDSILTCFYSPGRTTPLWLSGREHVSTFVPLLSRAQIENLPDHAREVVEYRKSGLSLNHIQGCPLDCAYCIRHTYGLWDQRVPRALMPDDVAVEQLVTHRYFRRTTRHCRSSTGPPTPSCPACGHTPWLCSAILMPVASAITYS